MNVPPENEIRKIVVSDLLSFHHRYVESVKRLNENVEDNLDYLRALCIELSQSKSSSLITKTPKIVRKRAIQRIETIPENDILQEDTSAGSVQFGNEEEKEINETVTGKRKRREASLRAADNIKKQQNSLLSKSKKLSNSESDDVFTKKGKRGSQIKRKKSVASSSDEEDFKRAPKYSKLDENLVKRKKSAEIETNKKSEQDAWSKKTEETIEKIKELNTTLQRWSSSRKLQNEESKKLDATTIFTADDIDEPSMYEDAIGKPIPIMNSTLKHNSVLHDKMLNATVVLEHLPIRKLNETVVIQKVTSQRNSGEMQKRNTMKTSQDNTQPYIEAMHDSMCNGLITDDESSPEVTRAKKQITNKEKIMTSSEDEIPNTPMIMRNNKDVNESIITQEIKTMYKSNALFSPYAKESVKKRVEAFEQAVMQSPKPVDIDEPVRITRTKTRAMAAAEAEIEGKNTDKNVTQVLARKSLAKAKKIAYFIEKQKKNEESKENKKQVSEQINKLFLDDKSSTKQIQQMKTTPVNKSKLLLPMSISRFHTPINQNLNYPKALTASRTNIVTNVDSFIQAPKTMSKTNSTEKLEEKKRYEEDARKKREEALRLQTEEKKRKRQEKELKNRMAREAKEKQELEKRQKAEKEKEEKARLAQLMQEKLREEAEKKRLAQLQRAQEKEERRKLEEQQRLQKLQEQEDAERLLAEQRRREQEAEKRKEMEARVQAAAEALKQKNQVLAAQAKYKQVNSKHKGVTNYVLDSEPDDDESDDESRPKYEIPHWAQTHVRKVQLAMQRHIPEEIVYKFFNTRKCTPDLAELFHGIDRNRLKRTSSAIWKTPPRFSMMEAE